MIEVRHYLTPQGCDPFDDWMRRLRDRRGFAAILLRIGRLERGLLGDAGAVGGGVTELRIDVGPGYRVYFGRVGDRIVVLLCRRRQTEAACGHRTREALLGGLLAADRHAVERTRTTCAST